MRTIRILITSLSLLTSGAFRPRDNNGGSGFRKFRIPDITITAQISNATALDLARPYYSPDVRVAGTACVLVKIDNAGNVIEARAISGHPLLVSSAIDAARKSKFTLKSDTSSPTITGIIPYTFTVPEDNHLDLRTLVGHRVTLRGQFSMRGKIGPFVVVSGQPVYLAPSGSFSWGKHYSRMEGKRVSVTGTLHFHKAPPPPEHPDSIAAALPDYFYFEAEHAIVRLDKPRH